MRIDISGVYPIIKEQSFYEMLELKKTLFIWVPLTLALYCSATRLSTDLNALSDHERDIRSISGSLAETDVSLANNE